MQILVSAARTASRNVGSLATKSGRDERIRILTLGQKIGRPKALSTLELAKWHYKVALLGLSLRRYIHVNCMNIV